MKKRLKLSEALIKAMEDLPINNQRAIEDANVYLTMTKEGFDALPAFWPDGTVRFYEVGGVLLGKSALSRFVETIKNR